MYTLLIVLLPLFALITYIAHIHKQNTAYYVLLITNISIFIYLVNATIGNPDRILIIGITIAILSFISIIPLLILAIISSLSGRTKRGQTYFIASVVSLSILITLILLL